LHADSRINGSHQSAERHQRQGDDEKDGDQNHGAIVFVRPT
jgi:hypothetical protein